MKNKVVVVLSLLLCISVGAAFYIGYKFYQKRTDYFTSGYFYHSSHNELMKNVPDSAKRVVFIGNSITAHWIAHDPGFFESNGYLCRGVSGENSSQLLLRFRRDVLEVKPRVVVINVGTNDIAENIGKYYLGFTFGNIQSMVELAQAHNIKVILSSVLPCNDIFWNKTVTDVPDKISHLNEMIKAYADENIIPYIDYYSALRDENSGLKKEYGEDSVHPNAEGYKVMRKIAEPIIENVLNQ